MVGSPGRSTTSTSSMPDDALMAPLRAADPWTCLSPAERALRYGDVEAVLVGFGDVDETPAPGHSAAAAWAAGRPTRRRHWRTLTVAVVGCAALAVSAFAMLGDGWTGEYASGTPDGLIWEDGAVVAQNADGTDTSEYIDAFAEGGLETVASLAPRELSLPTWITWDEIVERYVAAIRAQGPSWGVASARYYSSSFTHNAEIAWKTQWVEAYEAGDGDLQQEALTQWRVAIDANRDVWAPEQVEIPFELLAAAERGDVEAVRDDLRANSIEWITIRVGITAQVFDK